MGRATLDRWNINDFDPERNTMTVSPKTAKAVAERTKLIEKLTAEIDQLVADDATPPIPDDPRWDRMYVWVRFVEGGKQYEYLILRGAMGDFFTTGRAEGSAYFKSWDDLVTWLRSPDFHEVSTLRRMNVNPVDVLKVDTK